MNTENPMETPEPQGAETADAHASGDAFGIKIPRNAPCPCGSGRKYKKCCGADPETRARAAAASDLPDGVQALQDSEFELFRNKAPKWRMLLGAADDDFEAWVGKTTGKVMDGMVRPFAEKFCCFSNAIENGKSEVAFLQMRISGFGSMAVCPEVQLLEYDRLFDIFRDRLEECLANFGDTACMCEVRRDPMYGGPALFLEDGDGSTTIFMVAAAERWSGPSGF